MHSSLPHTLFSSLSVSSPFSSAAFLTLSSLSDIPSVSVSPLPPSLRTPCPRQLAVVKISHSLSISPSLLAPCPRHLSQLSSTVLATVSALVSWGGCSSRCCSFLSCCCSLSVWRWHGGAACRSGEYSSRRNAAADCHRTDWNRPQRRYSSSQQHCPHCRTNYGSWPRRPRLHQSSDSPGRTARSGEWPEGKAPVR